MSLGAKHYSKELNHGVKPPYLFKPSSLLDLPQLPGRPALMDHSPPSHSNTFKQPNGLALSTEQLFILTFCFLLQLHLINLLVTTFVSFFLSWSVELSFANLILFCLLVLLLVLLLHLVEHLIQVLKFPFILLLPLLFSLLLFVILFLLLKILVVPNAQPEASS